MANKYSTYASDPDQASPGSSILSVPSGTPPAPAYPLGCAVAGGLVWVTGGNLAVSAVPTINSTDPATGNLVSQVILGAVADIATDLVYDGSANLWTIGFITGLVSLVKIPVSSPGSFVVYPISGTANPTGRIAYENGNVWVSDNATDSVNRYLASSPAAPTATVATTGVIGSLGALVYDPNAAHYGGSGPRLFVVSTGNVDRIELTGNTVDDTLAISNVDWISLGDNAVWASSFADQKAFDLAVNPLSVTTTLDYSAYFLSPISTFYEPTLLKLFVWAQNQLTTLGELFRSDLVGNPEASSAGVPIGSPYPVTIAQLASSLYFCNVVGQTILEASALAAATITLRQITSPTSPDWVAASGDIVVDAFGVSSIAKLQGVTLTQTGTGTGSVLARIGPIWRDVLVQGDIGFRLDTTVEVKALRGLNVVASLASPLPADGSYLRYSTSGGGIIASGADYVVISPTITASQNDYAPTGWNKSEMLRLTSSGGAFNITGLDAAASSNTVKRLCNIGANNITLVHASGSSTASNRFLLIGAANRVLLQDETVTVWYDPVIGNWRLF